MKQWSLALYGSSGILSTFESGEAQFFIGTEAADDVLRCPSGELAARHTWVWIAPERMQVEDLAGGTRVNGHFITGRVEVEYPASVQAGDVTLVVKVKPQAQDFTFTNSIAQREAKARVANLEITVPQRVPHRGTSLEKSFDNSAHDAPLTGGYRLIREIARGGMGRIFFGEDPQLKRHVAVKVSRMSDGGEDPRFKNEAEVLAHLAHPNIVPIYNIGVDSQKRPFYAMKLVKGRTLQAILNAIKEGNTDVIREYTPATLLTIFRKVCDAMAFAHSQGILHRDLKPENVMVGEYGEVLVMDWGLAKVVGENQVDRTRRSQVTVGDTPSMTMEGEVMGTPQYMSPEQAAGMVTGLDARSDIYSLGGILYAILTLRPPIEGTSVEEVIGRVRRGEISAMDSNPSQKKDPRLGPAGGGGWIPEALQAVTLKAMATDRERRYPSVEAVAKDVDAYQNGFATSAEEAGVWKRAKLWVRRNKLLAGSAATMVLVVSGFTLKVISEGRRAKGALARLQETAPTFAKRAEEALRSGGFEEALKSIDFALDLEPRNGKYHATRGDILQVLTRWPEAIQAYRSSLQFETGERTKQNLSLTQSLVAQVKSEGTTKAKVALFEALNLQGRQSEAMEFGKELGDFWKEKRKDPNALPELVKRLEAKLLPVPGTKVQMCNTELTLGEWKLYFSAAGLGEWQQPTKDLIQTDDHPVINVSWNKAKEFCEWLSAKTGREWRLPTNAEWDAAVGNTTYPWGEYFPPHWDDGNYAITKDGTDDPGKVGVDGIFDTAPVGSFKPNALGFYDLGGNVWEWMWDAVDERTGNRNLRGSSWANGGGSSRASYRISIAAEWVDLSIGLRLVRGS
jgi:serine/threonine protein kinase/formylglycine-generating enzyme required for sulfatase activity